MQTTNKELYIGYPRNEVNPTGEPLPTQQRYHNSRTKRKLLAGGFGTGKTTSLVLELIAEVVDYPGNFVLLGGKDLGQLRNTALKELLTFLPSQLIVGHNETRREIELYNGSTIYYTHLDAGKGAEENIRSLNLGGVYVDQLETISYDVFLALLSRLRRHGAPKTFNATANPAGHNWVYWTFVKKDPEFVKPEDKHNYELFESITTENIYLPKEYIDSLLARPENWVQRYVYCSWDDFSGLVYERFNARNNVIESYEPTNNDNVVMSMDYGFRNPTCVLSAAVDYDGNIYVFDEYYKRQQLVDEISRSLKIKDWLPRATLVADPSIHRTESTGMSIFDQFNENGLWWTKADNDVAQGIDRVNELFGKKRLFITKNCVNLLREIGDYKWKVLKPGQVANEPEQPEKENDHAMDALRYLVNWVYAPIKPEKQTPRMPIGTRADLADISDATDFATF